jgi:3-isopropylmalate/(R)-2-methylmalate dehydratase large subunit
MLIHVAGDLQLELHKDVALYIISKLSTSGATGYFVEYAGKVLKT